MNTSILAAVTRMCFFNLEVIMKNKIFKPRYYKHIDKIVNIRDVMDKVKDKEYIKEHSFFPFISYTLKFKKFCSELDENTHQHWKFKERPIKYASHIDRCIYQWYSYNLNNKLLMII